VCAGFLMACKYNKVKLLFVVIACFIGGVNQLYGLECIPEFSAWFFNKGTVLGIYLFKHLAIEDLFFIVGCTVLFYFYHYLCKKIPDVLREKKVLHSLTIFTIVVIIQAMYQTAGIGAQQLIVVYTILPLILLLYFVGAKGIKLNFTGLYVLFVLVCATGLGWDFLNVTVLKHWVYDPRCELLSQRGFFFDGLLHTAISIQYNISGFIYFITADTIMEYFYGDKIEKK